MVAIGTNPVGIIHCLFVSLIGPCNYYLILIYITRINTKYIAIITLIEGFYLPMLVLF